MLRSTSGSNEFGSAVKVTVDGKLNANGITLRGGGTTSDQIRASMAGGAQLGGHIFIGADRALQMLGSMAAGAASTVIDQTLGNVLGAVGQRGMSPTSMLNAISLVLNRFVNHDSPIGGQIDIAGGVLTDKGLTVQGNRATARISTRTNRRLDDRHDGQFLHRRGRVGALPDHDRTGLDVLAVAQRLARQRQGPAGHGQHPAGRAAAAAAGADAAGPVALAGPQHSDPQHSDPQHFGR